MKKLLFLFMVGLLSLSACKKEKLYVHATLIGIDYRKCASPMCGGWFMEIKGDTLRFLEIPEKTDINLNGELKFPIPVKVIYRKYDNEWSQIKDLIFVKELFKR